MDPSSTTMIIGFLGMVLVIAAQGWQINHRIDKMVTKEDLDRALGEVRGEFRRELDGLKSDVKDNRERLILIQGHLGIVIRMKPQEGGSDLGGDPAASE